MNLSKEEKLEKAKRDYPVGTIIKCAWGFNLPETDLFRDDRNDTVTGLPYFSESEDSILVPCHPNRKVFLYDCYFNKWAEILPEEGIIDLSNQPNVTFAICDPKDEEITRLTEELKEAKAYREKVEAVINIWDDPKIREHILDHFVEKESKMKAIKVSVAYKFSKAMRDQFKQIK